MSTADHCRMMAEEADRMASIVSYGRDKQRLQQQAANWRARATDLEARASDTAAEVVAPGMMNWLRRRCG